VNGDITPCPFIDDVIMGNAFSQNFWEAFAGRNESAAYRDFMSLPSECAGCTYIKVCGGSCRAGVKDKAGKYLKKDFRCLGPWKEEFEANDMWDKMPTFF